MNTTRFFSLLFLIAMLASPVARAQPNATSSVDLTNYFDRASGDLRQLRTTIEATVEETPLAGRPQLAPYLNALTAAEQSLAAFKTASTSEFDRRQMEFERAKENAITFWEAYRSARAAPAESASLTASPAAESRE